MANHQSSSPAGFQQRDQGQKHEADATHHVADQLQPSRQLALQRAQERETLHNNALLETLKAKTDAAHADESHEAGNSGFEASAAQQRRLAAQAAHAELAEEAAGQHGQDSHTLRQQHLQEKHDAKYAQHVNRMQHSAPASAHQQASHAGLSCCVAFCRWTTMRSEHCKPREQ